MGSLHTAMRVYVDFHDDKNVPFSAVSKLFNLANVVTRDKIKPIKLEFWKDDNHQDALVAYSFNGWISSFHTLNPFQDGSQMGGDHMGANHIMVLDLEAAMDQNNYQNISISN